MMVTNSTFYKASWSIKLIVTTVIVLALIAFVGYQTVISKDYWATGLLLVVVVVTLALSVRGYSLTAVSIIVHRFGWVTTLPLTSLRSAELDPAATVGSLRIFGNGGFFGFVGRFRNARLGGYTAYVTDGLNCIVLRYTDKTVVISPDNPEAFVEQLYAQHPHLEHS